MQPNAAVICWNCGKQVIHFAKEVVYKEVPNFCICPLPEPKYKAGPELDRKVAVEVMKWTDEGDYWADSYGHQGWIEPQAGEAVWSPSTNMENAWQVARLFIKKWCQVTVDASASYVKCTIGRQTAFGPAASEFGVETAICLAALLAAEVNEGAVKNG